MGISSKAYDVVYEGLWDLYCKKPASLIDIPIKKLDGFVQKIKLIPPHSGVDEDGLAIPSPLRLPLRAIVRIRIPLIRPPPAVESLEDEEEEE